MGGHENIGLEDQPLPRQQLSHRHTICIHRESTFCLLHARLQSSTNSSIESPTPRQLSRQGRNPGTCFSIPSGDRGSLMYIANSTRPDIAKAVHNSARFVNAPTQWDVNKVKMILRYLRGTATRGIVFKDCQSHSICGYCDSDYASSLADPRSTSGYIFFTKGPSTGLLGSSV